jgi:hypothetical protein
MAVFELDLTDWVNFKRLKRRSPKLFARAAGSVLNSAAFGTRKLAIRNINADQIVRNKKFVSSSVRVNKARLTAPLSQQASEVGSIRRKRFSGWREQEGGQQTKREHYAKETARRGSRTKRVMRTVRLSSKKYPKPSDFRTKGNQVARAARMVHILSRSGYTKPFIILGLEKKARGRKPPPGLYRLGAGSYPNKRLTLLQRFKAPKKTKRKPWLKPAKDKYVRRVNLRTVWGRAVAHELKKAGVRI